MPTVYPVRPPTHTPYIPPTHTHSPYSLPTHTHTHSASPTHTFTLQPAHTHTLTLQSAHASSGITTLGKAYIAPNTSLHETPGIWLSLLWTSTAFLSKLPVISVNSCSYSLYEGSPGCGRLTRASVAIYVGGRDEGGGGVIPISTTQCACI